MKFDRFVDNIKYCSYPEKAEGWVDKVYYPRKMTVDSKVPEGLVFGREGFSEFRVKAWKEVEETGYGVYFYEEAPNVWVKLDNTNYNVTVTLVNPTENEYKAHIRANGILKANDIIVEPGEEKAVDFIICVVNGKVRLELLPGHLSELSEEVLCGSIFVKSVDIKLVDALLPGEKPSVYLASDSTVQPYGDKEYPLTGWGQELYLFFEEERADEDRHLRKRTVEGPHVIIENRAIGGRSSKSFIEEGRLDEILASIRPEDYLFIQWGHNDATAIRPNRYVAAKDFDIYIQYYIDAARQRGAIPVLVTPVARRNFDEPGGFKISFEEYRQQMIRLSKEQNVVLLDLGKKSAEFVETLGPEGSKDVFMWLLPGEYPDGNYADGLSDNTHLKEYGAMNFANILAGLIKEYQGDGQLDALKASVKPRKNIAKPVRNVRTPDTLENASVISGFAMQELSVEGDNANFLLNWNSVTAAEAYHVYRRIKQTGSYELVRKLTAKEKDTAATLPFAAPAGKVYEYYVEAVTAADGRECAKSRVIEIDLTV